MKVAIVVQRYGDKVIGGAESHARNIAEHLVHDLRWECDVYTSTAFDYQSWKPHYPQGEEWINNVRVRRFDVKFERNRIIFGIYNRLFNRFLKIWGRSNKKKANSFFNYLQYHIEKLWFILQGPYCPRMLKDLVENSKEYQKVFFFTYLYYPVVFGLPLIGRKSVLVPTAHDEDPLYFSQIKRMFHRSDTILANCLEEKKLIEKVFKKLRSNVLLAGVGVFSENEIVSGKTRKNLPSKKSIPYLLFLGRVCAGKGVRDLIDVFLKNAASCLCEMELHIAGPIDPEFQQVKHSKVIFLGVVNKAEKVSLIKNAFALVNPSPRESLSLVVLEALWLKTPILVNGENPVLAHYAQTRGSVFEYRDLAEFAEKINYLLSQEWLHSSKKALKSSSQWVQDEYSWHRVMSIYRSVAR